MVQESTESQIYQENELVKLIFLKRMNINKILYSSGLAKARPCAELRKVSLTKRDSSADSPVYIPAWRANFHGDVRSRHASHTICPARARTFRIYRKFAIIQRSYLTHAKICSTTSGLKKIKQRLHVHMYILLLNIASSSFSFAYLKEFKRIRMLL